MNLEARLTKLEERIIPPGQDDRSKAIRYLRALSDEELDALEQAYRIAYPEGCHLSLSEAISRITKGLDDITA